MASLTTTFICYHAHWVEADNGAVFCNDCLAVFEEVDGLVPPVVRLMRGSRMFTLEGELLWNWPRLREVGGSDDFDSAA